MKKWGPDKFINLPKNYKVYTGQGWNHQKMNRILYKLRKKGFFKQIGRFEFIRTEKLKLDKK